MGSTRSPKVFIGDKMWYGSMPYLKHPPIPLFYWLHCIHKNKYSAVLLMIHHNWYWEQYPWKFGAWSNKCWTVSVILLQTPSQSSTGKFSVCTAMKYNLRRPCNQHLWRLANWDNITHSPETLEYQRTEIPNCQYVLIWSDSRVPLSERSHLVHRGRRVCLSKFMPIFSFGILWKEKNMHGEHNLAIRVRNFYFRTFPVPKEKSLIGCRWR